MFIPIKINFNTSMLSENSFIDKDCVIDRYFDSHVDCFINCFIDCFIDCFIGCFIDF